MIKRFFSTDDSYKEMIAQYNKTDALLALGLYALMLVVYYFLGMLMVQKNIYAGVPANILLIALCVALVLIRKQKLASVGVTHQNIVKSLICGALVGIFYSFPFVVVPLIWVENYQLIPLGQALYNLFYYFVVISFSEEIIFRGLIQTRIYGLIKKDELAILVTGLLFYAMHLPFQMLANGMRIYLPDIGMKVAMHCLLNAMYKKYNSIVAPTVFHGFIQWIGDLFWINP